MTEFTARPANADDAEFYYDWLKASSDINLVDLRVYEYPTCNTVVIEKEGEPILMNSFHCVLMMEALAPKPGLPPKDEARALRVLFDAVTRVAQGTHQKEIWFGCSDERVIKFAQRHGVELVTFPVMRMKLQ